VGTIYPRLPRLACLSVAQANFGICGVWLPQARAWMLNHDTSLLLFAPNFCITSQRDVNLALRYLVQSVTSDTPPSHNSKAILRLLIKCNASSIDLVEHATKSHDPYTISLLLDLGADIRSIRIAREGYSTLHLAVIHGCQSIVEILARGR
jgi:hypothetical protein